MMKELIEELYLFSKNRLGFDRPAKLVLKKDQANSKQILGKTAYYDPENYTITVFISKRHPKDCLRSFAHELVHHTQNCRGDFFKGVVAQEGYAQKDEKLRELEREAYEQGNLIFRDFEDFKKYNSKTHGEIVAESLMKMWGYKTYKKEKEIWDTLEEED